MTRNKLLLSGTGIAAAGLILFTAFGLIKKDGQSLYRPSDAVDKLGVSTGEEEDANGAAEWWFNRVKNNVTNELDYADMAAVQERAQQNFNSTARQGNGNQQTQAATNWSEIGPDNVGGRTRAILIDRNNSQHMYAGGVSGGLWESTDGANNWTRVAGFFNIAGVNINISTIAQASDGTLYVGTGEGNFYPPYGSGAGGFIGGGIYKSPDGVNWSLLSSTAPVAANNTSTAWADVNKIVIDPADPNHIYAGTNKGLKISTDGGSTWVSATGTPVTACTDVEISNNQHVIAVCSNKPYLSTDNGGTFTNVGTTALGFSSVALGRTDVAIAPSDPNFVYAFCAAANGSMAGVFVSVDGAQTWTQVCGAGNQQFEPFGYGTNQGTYDNVVAVDPSNKYRAIFGGVELWQWEMTSTAPPSGQWTRIALEFTSLLNPYYVHSDKHAIVFNPSNPAICFVGCDGGIFRSTNISSSVPTWQPMNAGYNVTQCYSVAFDHVSPGRNVAMAGCQDNGTQFVNGLGNTTMSADQVGGGDGAMCDISYLNPQALFGTVYYGSLARSNNGGSSSSQFYDARIQGLTNFEQAGFANFVTPIRLWESLNDQLTGDSIPVINETNRQNILVTSANSGANFTGTLTVPSINATPAPSVVLSSVEFYCGNDTLVTNGAGTVSGDGTGTVNTNGTYNITFNTAPSANQILKVKFDVTFGSGTMFVVNSNVQGRTLQHTISSTLNPGDTLKVQDVVQSHLAVGFTGNNGIWITRRAIDFSTTPLWIKIGGSLSQPSQYGGESSCMTWSADGNLLYVGTSSGTVYRFSNLAYVTDSANGDIEHGSAANPNTIVRCQLIGSFGSRNVTAIDVDPSDPGRIVVSLGNYSNSQYVYYSTTADTASGVAAAAFVDKTGNLDNIGGVPVYSVTFDKYNPNRVLVGTEHGVYETSNITAGAPSWTSANNGLDNVVVDMIRQQRWDPWLVPNAGCFYIGTHGRGMWRDDSSWQQPTGINNPSQPSNVGSLSNNDLKVFPNPVVDNSNVTFLLGQPGDVTVTIYDLNGKRVFSRNYENLASGANTVQFETTDLVKGTYIIAVQQGAKRIGTGRFIKLN